jgi:hypothetical protein
MNKVTLIQSLCHCDNGAVGNTQRAYYYEFAQLLYLLDNHGINSMNEGRIRYGQLTKKILLIRLYNMDLWNIDTEKRFFTEALKNSASLEKLFYSLKSRENLHIYPKIATLKDKLYFFAVNTVECPAVGFAKRSEANLAFFTTDSKLKSAKS